MCRFDGRPCFGGLASNRRHGPPNSNLKTLNRKALHSRDFCAKLAGCARTQGGSTSSVGRFGSRISGLLSNQGAKSINFYFIMVPLKEKSIKVWDSKAQIFKLS